MGKGEEIGKLVENFAFCRRLTLVLGVHFVRVGEQDVRCDFVGRVRCVSDGKIQVYEFFQVSACGDRREDRFAGGRV